MGLVYMRFNPGFQGTYNLIDYWWFSIPHHDRDGCPENSFWTLLQHQTALLTHPFTHMNKTIPLQCTDDYHLKWHHCKWDVQLEGVFACPWGNVTARISRTKSKWKKNYFLCLPNKTYTWHRSRQEKQSSRMWLKGISNDQKYPLIHLPKCQGTQKSITDIGFLWIK